MRTLLPIDDAHEPASRALIAEWERVGITYRRGGTSCFDCLVCGATLQVGEDDGCEPTAEDYKAAIAAGRKVGW